MEPRVSAGEVVKEDRRPQVSVMPRGERRGDVAHAVPFRVKPNPARARADQRYKNGAIYGWRIETRNPIL